MRSGDDRMASPAGAAAHCGRADHRLDVTIQAQILQLMRELHRETARRSS